MQKPLPWIAAGVVVALLAIPAAHAQDPRRAAPAEAVDDLPLVPWAHPPQPAELPPSPPDGGGFFIGAGLLLTFGSLTTAAAGACRTNNGPWSESCLGGVLGAGGGMLALGGALMAVGAVKRSRFRAWQRQHLPPPRPARVVLAPALGGGMLLWSGSF